MSLLNIVLSMLQTGKRVSNKQMAYLYNQYMQTNTSVVQSKKRHFGSPRVIKEVMDTIFDLFYREYDDSISLWLYKQDEKVWSIESLYEKKAYEIQESIIKYLDNFYIEFPFGEDNSIFLYAAELWHILWKHVFCTKKQYGFQQEFPTSYKWCDIIKECARSIEALDFYQKDPYQSIEHNEIDSKVSYLIKNTDRYMWSIVNKIVLKNTKKWLLIASIYPLSYKYHQKESSNMLERPPKDFY